MYLLYVKKSCYSENEILGECRLVFDTLSGGMATGQHGTHVPTLHTKGRGPGFHLGAAMSSNSLNLTLRTEHSIPPVLLSLLLTLIGEEEDIHYLVATCW